VIEVGSQEVSKPVMITVVAIAVILIGFVGWYFFMRTPSSDNAAPMGGPGMAGPGGPGMGGPGGPGMRPMPGPGPR
jgi:hypothetical protein